MILDSRELPGKVDAAGTGDVNPADYDLVGLAMQEPQYRSPGVRELLDAVAKSGVPCMSIMNMPPLPYIKRIPGLDTSALEAAYTDASVWANFDPARLTRGGIPERSGHVRCARLAPPRACRALAGRGTRSSV